MFIYSSNDSSIHLNHFYYTLFTFYTRATAIYTPTPIPNDDFSPFLQIKRLCISPFRYYNVEGTLLQPLQVQ